MERQFSWTYKSTKGRFVRVLVGVSMESDVTYFARRATEERARAARAANDYARAAHLELAARYDDLQTAIAASDKIHAPDLRLV